ncbi:hypothetical protein FKM82_011055 [Ascaphus truei]
MVQAMSSPFVWLLLLVCMRCVQSSMAVNTIRTEQESFLQQQDAGRLHGHFTRDHMAAVLERLCHFGLMNFLASERVTFYFPGLYGGLQ